MNGWLKEKAGSDLWACGADRLPNNYWPFFSIDFKNSRPQNQYIYIYIYSVSVILYIFSFNYYMNFESYKWKKKFIIDIHPNAHNAMCDSTFFTLGDRLVWFGSWTCDLLCCSHLLFQVSWPSSGIGSRWMDAFVVWGDGCSRALLPLVGKTRGMSSS